MFNGIIESNAIHTSFPQIYGLTYGRQPAGLEGTRTPEERSQASGVATRAAFTPEADIVQWENEPPLTASQCVFTQSSLIQLLPRFYYSSYGRQWS